MSICTGRLTVALWVTERLMSKLSLTNVDVLFAHHKILKHHYLTKIATKLKIKSGVALYGAHGLIIRAPVVLSRAHGLARLNNYFPHGTAGAP